MIVLRRGIITLLVGLLVGVIGGCADHPIEVPADGVKVAEGNSKLMYKAPRPGEIFIFESPDNRLVYRGLVKAGDVVRLDNQDNRITINGKTVSETPLKPGRNYRMFYDQADPKK